MVPPLEFDRMLNVTFPPRFSTRNRYIAENPTLPFLSSLKLVLFVFIPYSTILDNILNNLFDTQ